MARHARKQREIDDTRGHILAAAARVFASKGFDAATMHEIAAEAGYSAPSLYSYFKGKQDIVDGLAAHVLSTLPELFVLALPQGLTLPQRVELLLRHFNAWVERHRDAIVFMSKHKGPAPKLPENVTHMDVGRQITDAYEAWFRAQASEDELGQRHPRDAAMALLGLHHAYFEDWLQRGAEGSLNASLPIVLDMFFHGVCRAR